ncbi:MAG: divalent-cation tolerance protein CutA [Planctomycetota bacterium]|jgi:periplasmic divalent cation tolerance protein|nr:divalent-cation tolerance protein CutA [Deltaproteobacteria bacterium]MDP6540537.1 divalent-cation tolerance protein CutA [Planctomycetota bacterium]
MVVLVTVPDAETGAQIGRTLVAERLAACVNLVPGLRSIYRWEGEIQDDAEVLLLVKTRADRLPELSSRVEALHPYELPEVLALAAAGGSPAYLDWVCSEASP